MAQIMWRLQQGFDFIAAQNQRQLLFAPRKRNAFDGDLPVEGMGIEEAQCADHQHIGGRRHLLFFDQEQLKSTNVFGTELIGWFAEVLGKRLDGVQIEPDRGRRILADLKVFQHPLSKCGHNKTPMMFCQLQPGFRLSQDEETALHLVPGGAVRRESLLLQNGAQEARARRCLPRRSEPLPPSTVLLLRHPTTDGAAGTRCLDSRWWVPELSS